MNKFAAKRHSVQPVITAFLSLTTKTNNPAVLLSERELKRERQATGITISSPESKQKT